MSEQSPYTSEQIEALQQEGLKRMQEAMQKAQQEQVAMQEVYLQQQQQEQAAMQQQQPQQPQVESCGGPLVCMNCAMRYSQSYLNMGKGVWADYYYRHAIKLRNESEIGRLQQENQQLALQNSQLEKEMWKTYTGSNGVS